MMRTPGRVQKAAAAIGLIVTAVVILTGASTLAGVLRKTPTPRTRQVAHGKVITAGLSLPRPVKPAFVPDNNPLRAQKAKSQWALVQRPVKARAHPSLTARVVSRVSTRTPEGTANIVSVIGSTISGQDHVWVHVHLPVLPNGTTGWIPRSSLGGYGFVSTRLVVDLHSYRATLYRGRRKIFTAPVGVGKTSSPTPTGRFYIRDKVTHYGDAFYGPVAFGTSARSATLTDWPAGGFIGIHGTDQPDLIPGAISHGCIRMTDRDIERLSHLMPVGTPVRIR